MAGPWRSKKRTQAGVFSTGKGHHQCLSKTSQKVSSKTNKCVNVSTTNGKSSLKFLYTNADQFVNKRDELIMFIA